ncbi:unnamed protein product [Phytophthora fragariaefolia]|uniref:Unnamed protein product n=1 Tax=Phytophthora fragariaefolia TaxID=1490495 RepID=A0A9W7D4B4_9STRA|nr:unnamed protein product [Phytophthora fragariaefolia]
MSRRYLTPASASQRAATPSGDSSWESFRKLFASAADPQTQNNHARHLALTKNILYENELGCDDAQQWADVKIDSEIDPVVMTNQVEGGGATARQRTPQVVGQQSARWCPAVHRATCPGYYEMLQGEKNFRATIIVVLVAAAEALRMFATGASKSNNPKGRSDDLRLTPKGFSQNLLGETGTVDVIVAVIHDLFPDDDPKEEEQECQPLEGSLDLTEDQDSTEEQTPTQNQEQEESTNNENLETQEANIQPNPQGVETLQPSKRALSAPQNGYKTAAHADSVGIDKLQGGNENDVVGTYQVHARPTKPASAPSVIHHGPSNEVDASLSPNIQEKNVDLPENCEDKTTRPRSASKHTQEDQQVNEAESSAEEKVERVVGDDLPLQMRLSALLFPLIDLVYELSSYQRCAEVLVVSGALHYIIFILEHITNPQDELLPLCLEILWNVLELSHEKMSAISKCTSRRELLEVFRLRNATFFLGNEFTLRALLHVLELLLAHGYRQQDKEMRNECLMILQLLAKRRRSLDFFYATGLTACLFSYATSAELSHAKGSETSLRRSQQDKFSATASAITANNQYYATNSDEDFEFKQMLWFLLAEISCDHQANLSELEQFRFIEIWLSYATVSNGNGNSQKDEGAPSRASAHKYSTPQLKILQWTALGVLNHVASFVIDHFYEVCGHVKLLDFLQLNMGTEDVLASAWLLMLQISSSYQFFQAELGKLGAVEAAIEIFEAPPSRHTFAIRRNAILACASMCRNDDGSNRKRFRLANGIHILIQHLEFDPSHSVLEENILIGIIDAVRSCVIGDVESETAFINDDGVPKLLSVLGSAPKALKHQTLAALAEICVNPAAIPSYQSWRCDQPGDNNDACANEVLLRIYADEEVAEKEDSVGGNNFDIQPTSNLVSFTNIRHSAFQSVTTCRSPFIITSESSIPHDAAQSPPTRPESPAFARLKHALKAGQGLVSYKQSLHSVLQLDNHRLHPEVNLKAKIHSVLANVSFGWETESLTPQDQVMLEIAKEYPTFKLGEMWQNVERALHAEGVRPIYADALYIRKNIEHAYNISICTKLAQQEVFTRSRQQNTECESAIFEQILRQKHQESQAEEFHRANRRQNSTMQLHLDAKKTRLEFMRRQDPAAFAAYESEERCLIRDPPPEYIDEQEACQTLLQNEADLRNRLSTITRHRKHTA